MNTLMSIVYMMDYFLNTGMKKFQGAALEDVNILSTVIVAKKRLSDRYILFTIGFESVGGIKFKPGDHINIFPENDPVLVSKVLSHLTDLPKEEEIITWNGLYTSRVLKRGKYHKWIQS